jgi:hypothetical protein
VPLAYAFARAWEAAAAQHSGAFPPCWVARDFSAFRPLFVERAEHVSVSTIARSDGVLVKLGLNDQLYYSGRFAPYFDASLPFSSEQEPREPECLDTRAAAEIYSTFEARGLLYGTELRRLVTAREVQSSPSVVVAEVNAEELPSSRTGAAILVDSALQSLLAHELCGGLAAPSGVYLPVWIEECRISARNPRGRRVLVESVLRRTRPQTGIALFDLEIRDEQETAWCRLKNVGLKLSPADVSPGQS